MKRIKWGDVIDGGEIVVDEEGLWAATECHGCHTETLTDVSKLIEIRDAIDELLTMTTADTPPEENTVSDVAEVERVARAIYEEANPPDNPWCEPWNEIGDFTQNRYRRLSRAALAARGPRTDAEEAVARVEAACAELLKSVDYEVTHYRDGLRDAARQIRAALDDPS